MCVYQRDGMGWEEWDGVGWGELREGRGKREYVNIFAKGFATS